MKFALYSFVSEAGESQLYEKQSNLYIDLRKVPREGSFYQFEQKKGSVLSQNLFPLIGENSFRISLQVGVLLDVYEISGDFEVDFDLVCSLCAHGFTLPIRKAFKEYIIVEDKNKASQSALPKRVLNSKTEDASFCHYLSDSTLNLSDFIHEQFALAEPERPLGKPDCDKSCENYKKSIESGHLKGKEEGVSNSPFSVLKGLKTQK